MERLFPSPWPRRGHPHARDDPAADRPTDNRPATDRLDALCTLGRKLLQALGVVCVDTGDDLMLSGVRLDDLHVRPAEGVQLFVDVPGPEVRIGTGAVLHLSRSRILRSRGLVSEPSAGPMRTRRGAFQALRSWSAGNGALDHAVDLPLGGR